MWGVSVTHPMLASFLWAVSLTLPVLALLFCGVFLLHIQCCFLSFFLPFFQFFFSFFFFFFFFFFFWGVPLTNPELVALFIAGDPLTHPVLASFLSGEFLFHIPCWLHFYVGSFSDTSHAGFTFIWLVCLTHPMLALLL